MASKYTAYRIVYCGDAAGVDQVGVGKLLEEGWELWRSPFVRSNTVYQAMVKPAEGDGPAQPAAEGVVSRNRRH